MQLRCLRAVSVGLIHHLATSGRQQQGVGNVTFSPKKRIDPDTVAQRRENCRHYSYTGGRQI